MMTFLQAIAHQEGFNIGGSRSQRNNNPGDIDWGPFAQHHGATGLETIPHGYNETPRFAVFPTPEAGFAAMRALLQIPGVFGHAPGQPGVRRLLSGYAGATVREALYRWAPPSDGNNTSAYEKNVCANAGCQPTDCIDSLV